MTSLPPTQSSHPHPPDHVDCFHTGGVGFCSRCVDHGERMARERIAELEAEVERLDQIAYFTVRIPRWLRRRA